MEGEKREERKKKVNKIFFLFIVRFLVSATLSLPLPLQFLSFPLKRSSSTVLCVHFCLYYLRQVITRGRLFFFGSRRG